MKKNAITIFATCGTLFLLLFQPVREIVINKNYDAALSHLGWALLIFLPFFAIYYVNHFYAIPKFLLTENNTRKFWIFNLLFFLVVFFIKSIIQNAISDDLTWSNSLFLLIPNIMMSFLVIGTSLGIKYYLKNVEDLKKEKERQKAELQWLKNQLNPHFLFNTMNNISGQIYTNPDEAQENLSRLSDVLRYALYETAADKVPIQGEIEFMENYICLMKLRCSNKTTVNVDFQDIKTDLKILPLLYVSLIENAFKHGVSNKTESFIDILLKQDDKKLIFVSKNSNFPKSTENRSGHGIGLENLKRRLELAYNNSYSFNYGVEGEVFVSKLEINY